MARDAALERGQLLITTDFVVDETLTLIRFRLGLCAPFFRRRGSRRRGPRISQPVEDDVDTVKNRTVRGLEGQADLQRFRLEIVAAAPGKFEEERACGIRPEHERLRFDGAAHHITGCWKRGLRVGPAALQVPMPRCARRESLPPFRILH